MPDINHAVVQQLYEAATGGVCWNVALEGVHAAMAVSASQLFIIDKSNGQLALADNSDASPPDAMLDYIREYHRIDPHVAYAATLPVGEVLHTAAVFDRAQYADHPYYREMWAAHNVREVLGAKVAETTGHVAMFGVTRCYDLPPFTDDDVEMMRRYTSHLVAALQISNHLQHMQNDAVVGHGLMQASGRPMLLLDPARVVVSTNDLGRELIERRDLFTLRGATLECLRASSAKLLDEALASIQRSREASSSGVTGKRIGVRLAGADGQVRLCSLWDLQPESTMAAFGARPAILLTVTHPRVIGNVDPMWLGALFELSPAEVRVAAGLMRGDGLSEIAIDLRLSINTVRSQLKSISAKTRTHRQADLVALLLRVSAP